MGMLVCNKTFCLITMGGRLPEADIFLLRREHFRYGAAIILMRPERSPKSYLVTPVS